MDEYKILLVGMPKLSTAVPPFNIFFRDKVSVNVYWIAVNRNALRHFRLDLAVADTDDWKLGNLFRASSRPDYEKITTVYNYLDRKWAKGTKVGARLMVCDRGGKELSRGGEVAICPRC